VAATPVAAPYRPGLSTTRLFAALGS